MWKSSGYFDAREPHVIYWPMAKKPTSSRKTRPAAGAILDAALALAERDGWANVRMMHVAAHLNCSLAAVHAHYRDMDAIADAWFGRALAALLAPPPRGFAKLPPKERMFIILTRWLDALAAHRTVSAQMIGQKLYPSHPHHWVPMVFSLSRLVHALLDAALIDSRGRQRQAEELGGTLLVLATLRVWCGDGSAGQERTRAFLKARLDRGDRLMSRVFG